jgi:hypothetical protein
MRKLLVFAALLFAASIAYAAKPCDELKAEIAKKIEANGVKSYTLDIVDKDKEAEGKVVGSCDGGIKKIVYNRGSAPAKAPETGAKKD